MKRLDFIKKIGLATVGLPLLSSFEVFSFTKGYQQVIYPPVDDRFETFDFELFEMVKKFDKNYNFEDLSESKKILYKYIENFN